MKPADPHFASNADRTLHWLQLVEIIIQLHSWEDEEALIEITDALACAPALAISVVFDHPEALDAVRAMNQRVDGHVMVGMSKIESAEDVRLASAAGAQFLLGAGYEESVRQEARRRDILYLPGVLSRAEVTAAQEAGLRALFLFPADIFGAEHVKELRQDFPDSVIFPGVDIGEEELGEYAAAGATAAVLELPVLGTPAWRQADIITWVRTMLRRWRAGLPEGT